VGPPVTGEVDDDGNLSPFALSNPRAEVAVLVKNPEAAD
jgi:hypothetical protein